MWLVGELGCDTGSKLMTESWVLAVKVFWCFTTQGRVWRTAETQPSTTQHLTRVRERGENCRKNSRSAAIVSPPLAPRGCLRTGIKILFYPLRGSVMLQQSSSHFWTYSEVEGLPLRKVIFYLTIYHCVLPTKSKRFQKWLLIHTIIISSN